MSPESVKRVCILTGGGDAPGLNAVIRAFVRGCMSFGLEVFGSEDGFEGLVQPGRIVPLDWKSIEGILPRGGSMLGCSNRGNPFAYPTVDSKGNTAYVDASEQVIQRLADHQIDVTVMVGGDGTMNHALRLQKKGLKIVGVPKTIDNDLAGTDVTFGFNTAVQTATMAIDALHSTAESHDRVMIVELMGRDAGWIALYAGIAGGADVVLIPEIPYEIGRVEAAIRERATRGATFAIVVIGEGAKPKGGEVSTVQAGRTGHLARLGGAGHRLALELQDHIPHEIRVTVLGHLLRGGSPSSWDRVLGTRFGVKAAELCRDAKVGRLVSLDGDVIVDVPLERAVEGGRRVPLDGEIVSVARRIGVELGG
ncbi:MAG: ATP-dependent 6-phosphofructokinase [Myxococcales bacterium]|nr:ATP-dependent 6-phosphofructokinase [Myxococcales bacterium]MCB9708102.1 ATP-dependent 6-phosphofructokinase [Myxococcales bacterium]